MYSPALPKPTTQRLADPTKRSGCGASYILRGSASRCVVGLGRAVEYRYLLRHMRDTPTSSQTLHQTWLSGAHIPVRILLVMYTLPNIGLI